MPYRDMTVPQLITALRATGREDAEKAAELIEELFPYYSARAPLEIDMNENCAVRNKRKVRLSPSETVLVYILHRRLGRATPIDMIQRELHGAHAKVATNTVRQSIPMLRRKLKVLGVDIVNHFKQGYSLELIPVTQIRGDEV